ncbi:uncharacterized protein [Montipora foliosa]|uniref:uncharacterized protein n=1 Tax=Montipora foliosa TaxID=591990 RepID=UPI0035F17270
MRDVKELKHKIDLAAVEPYRFEPERVPDENLPSDEDTEEDERSMSLNWAPAAVVSSERQQESASAVLKCPNLETSSRKVMHENIWMLGIERRPLSDPKNESFMAHKVTMSITFSSKG